MTAMLNAFLPILAFMLIPVWIPIIATLGGKAADLVTAPIGRD